MKYLITGGAGFIGSSLSEDLLKQGDEVIVLDNLSTGRYENIEYLLNNKNFEFVEGDILDVRLVDKLVGIADNVFHLAAASEIIKDIVGYLRNKKVLQNTRLESLRCF